jgi:hypothetical protein
MTLESALNNIPLKFREKIITYFLEIKKRAALANYNSDYDSLGLSLGKLCEVILRFLQHEITGTHTPFGEHIKNFAQVVDTLGKTDKTKGSDSVRILIPRALNFLYTVRNKRAIGHVGGDIEANEIDMSTSVRIADWIMCELIRVYHKLSIEEAQDIIDTISTRNLPIIWEVNGKKRILRTDLNHKEKVLLLLYSDSQNTILIEDLFEWVEYSNLSMFKTSVLKSLHDDRLIEYDREMDTIQISPLGNNMVEKRILKQPENSHPA